MCANRDQCHLQGRALCSSAHEVPKAACSDGIDALLREIAAQTVAAKRAAERQG